MTYFALMEKDTRSFKDMWATRGERRTARKKA